MKHLSKVATNNKCYYKILSIKNKCICVSIDNIYTIKILTRA